MKQRHVYVLGLLVAVGLLVSIAVPASAGPSAGGPKAPDVSINWQFGTSSPFGGTRFDGQYVADSRRVYFLGFRTFSDLTDGSIWYYDVATDTYVDTMKDMPAPVSNYKIVPLTDSHGLGLWVFGGRDANAQITTHVQVYYPGLNQAFDVTSDPWPGLTSPSSCVSLPGTGATGLNNLAYVMGGLATSANGCADETSNQTWIFDPNAPAGSRWTQGPNLNVSRAYVTAEALGPFLFAIGGTDNIAGTLHALQTVERWKPPSGGWNDASIADLPVPCAEMQAFPFKAGPLAKKIALAGCGQWPNAIPDSYVYDGLANTWSLAGSLNEPRRDHAGYLIGTRMVILGGYDCPGGACLADPTVTSEIGVGAPLGSAPSASQASASSGAKPSTT
jgi:hypothetical protein